MRFVLTVVVFSFLTSGSVSGNSNWDYYHKTNQILEFFSAVAQKHPSRARYEEIPDPESDSQFRLPLVTITDFASGEEGKEVVLLVAGEHARELITAEIAYWLGVILTGEKLEELTEWAAIQPIQATAWRSGWTKGTLAEWANELLKKVVFKIFPVENIAGRKAVESGTACLRTTISGIDLNRNWPHAWQQADQGADEYGGAKPLSEPETRIVKLVAQNSRPQAYVNLHSGEWAMYVPWDSRKDLAPELPADTSDLLEKMNAYCECMKGAAGQVAGYLAMGTSMDWMYTEQHVPYPLTFEVYGPHGLGKLEFGGHPRKLTATGGMQNSTVTALHPKQRLLTEETDNSCMTMFNPVTREEYESTVASWLGALLVLADHLNNHPHASAVSQDAIQQQLPEPQTPPTKQELSRRGAAVVKSAHDAVIKKGGFPLKSGFGLGRKAAIEAGPSSGWNQSQQTTWLSTVVFSLLYAALLAGVGCIIFLFWVTFGFSKRRANGRHLRRASV